MFSKFQFKNIRWAWALAAILLLGSQVAWASSSAAPAKMHIMEGFLPFGWAIFWWVIAIPFWVIGFMKVRHLVSEQPEQRLLLGLAGGFVFVLSALKIPSVTGSSSHPTGTGLGTMLFGPFVIGILGTIALIFQALLVAHGGISTLGANAMSMAIGGPLIAYYLVWLPLRGSVPTWLSVGLTAFVADLATYLITTTQLALAFPDATSGFIGSWLTFAAIFAVTQIPLAIGEGILTVLIFNALQSSATVNSSRLAWKEFNMTTQSPPQPKRYSIWIILLGILAIVLLSGAPLIIVQDSEFGGSDGVGSEVVATIAPDYDNEWITNWWSPPGGETESMLFALQATVGGILIGYFFGYLRGRNSPKPEKIEDRG